MAEHSAATTTNGTAQKVSRARSLPTQTGPLFGKNCFLIMEMLSWVVEKQSAGGSERFHWFSLTPKKGKTFYVLVLGSLPSSSLWAARCCRNNNSIAGNTIMNTATWNYYAHHHLNDTNLDFPIDYISVGEWLVLGFFRRHRASEAIEANSRYNVITFHSTHYRQFRGAFENSDGRWGWSVRPLHLTLRKYFSFAAYLRNGDMCDK